MPEMTNPLEDFVKNIKSKRTPNLFTALTVEHNEFGEILITAKDMHDLAVAITTERYTVLQSQNIQLIGDGSKDNPFVLTNVDEWLWAAIKFEEKEPQQFIFYKIAEQLVDIETKERKASYKDESIDITVTTSDDLFEILLQSVQNLMNPEGIAILRQQISNLHDPHTSMPALFPFLFYLTQGSNAKYNSEKKLWDKPYYSQLAKAHNDAQGFVKEKIASVTSETIDLARTEMKNATFPVEEIANFNLEKVPERLLDEAFSRFSIDKNQPEVQEFLSVFKMMGRMLANASGKIQDKGHASAATFFQELIESAKEVIVENNLTDEFSLSLLDGSQNFDTMFAQATDLLKNNITNHANDFDQNKSILKNLDNLCQIAVIKEIRSILANRVNKPNIYLPVALAALFFSETSRHSPCFIASLAILDLIETKQQCPDILASYSVYNMLKNVDRSEFVDAYGRLYSDDPASIREPLGKAYKVYKYRNHQNPSFKINKMKEKEKNEIAALVNKLILGETTEKVAGYHPMVQGKSFKEVDKVPQDDKLNLVQQKIANILLQWIAFQLSKNGFDNSNNSSDNNCNNNSPRFNVRLEKFFLDELSPKKSVDKDEFIDEYIKPLLRSRLKSFELMGTTDLIMVEHQKENTNNTNLDNNSNTRILKGLGHKEKIDSPSSIEKMHTDIPKLEKSDLTDTQKGMKFNFSDNNTKNTVDQEGINTHSSFDC